MCLKAFGTRGVSIRETRVVSESIQTATCRTQQEHIFKRDNTVIHKEEFRWKRNGMRETEETEDKRVKDKRGNSSREEIIKSKCNCNKQQWSENWDFYSDNMTPFSLVAIKNFKE